MPRFLALYLGDASDVASSRGLPDRETQMAGMLAWGRWMTTHAAQILDAGGPLGRTKRVSPSGIEDTRNALTGYVVVEAESHEAAASLFRDHPHFAIFPGKCVEIMECLPIPGA